MIIHSTLKVKLFSVYVPEADSRSEAVIFTILVDFNVHPKNAIILPCLCPVAEEKTFKEFMYNVY